MIWPVAKSRETVPCMCCRLPKPPRTPVARCDLCRQHCTVSGFHQCRVAVDMAKDPCPNCGYSYQFVANDDGTKTGGAYCQRCGSTYRLKGPAL